MIQELFGGSSPLIGSGERKITFTNGAGIILEGTPAASPSPSPSASPSSSSTSSVAVAATTGAIKSTEVANATDGQQNNNLRCPRCDSSNTKFCYYNNYNLTQPRHFCKTCRRYWTKGGALRNVPIGGGCRKNKTSTVSSSVTKTSATKFKTGHLMGGFDAELPSSPVFWAPPQSSQILALLRGNPINPNSNPSSSPSPNPNPISTKEDGNIFGIGTNMITGPNGLGLGLDPLISQLPSIGLCGSSFWRNNGNNHHQMGVQQNQLNHHNGHNGFHQFGEMQNSSGMQALYQRMKISTGDCDDSHRNSPAANQIMAAPSSSSMASILEQAPMPTSGDQLGYWNSAPAFCWSDLPTTTSNGAYP